MRRFAMCVLVCLVLVGCSNKASQIKSYLIATDAITADFQTLGGEYQKMGQDLAVRSRANPGQMKTIAADLQPQLKTLQTRFEAIQGRLKALQPPPEAADLQSNYESSFAAFQQALQAYQALTEAIAAGEQRPAQIRASMETLQAALKQATESAAKAGEARQKLLKEFGLKTGSDGKLEP